MIHNNGMIGMPVDLAAAVKESLQSDSKQIDL